jgi:polyisoprenoid-binding protein YceI
MLALLVLCASLHAQTLRFGPADGSVGFDATSNLHAFSGAAEVFEGTLDTDALRGLLRIQTASLTTRLGPRDARMLDYCLEATRFPEVQFRVEDIEGDAALLRAESGSGSITLVGTLTVRDVARTVRVMATVSHEGGGLRIRGRHALRWPDFGVPDPSVLLARLEPELTVTFDITARPAAEAPLTR